MSYVDGFVIPVPKKKVDAYRRMAKVGLKLWMKHGAVDYKECVGDDLKNKWGINFPKMMRLKKSETVVFSFIVFKSRKHRDQVNARVMKDPSMGSMPSDMPFDMKRMAYGGFRTIVE